MQDLVAYVAERLPAQAEYSLPSSISTQHEQPWRATHDRADIVNTLAGILSNVLGADIPAQQPFMEASDPLYCVSLW